ncbi:hypothetical protein DPMN_098276 [Dreissena polymorpha]|uniref:Uncharacterized protein n=1 Tax=Dreissena polymorpha TaxID=45954 RepID=A0A9D4R5B9_DREPO|nr:hypothetical protein DPMN_098276 [Dreissena polymorpha]
MIVGDLCVAKEPVMNATKLDCIPAAEYKTMCNQTQAVKCVDLRELVNTAMKAESTEDFTDLCRYVQI